MTTISPESNTGISKAIQNWLKWFRSIDQNRLKWTVHLHREDASVVLRSQLSVRVHAIIGESFISSTDFFVSCGIQNWTIVHCQNHLFHLHTSAVTVNSNYPEGLPVRLVRTDLSGQENQTISFARLLLRWGTVCLLGQANLEPSNRTMVKAVDL